MIVVLLRSHGTVTEALGHCMFSRIDQFVIFRDEKSVQDGFHCNEFFSKSWRSPEGGGLRTSAN